jgi:hypothetical protein
VLTTCFDRRSRRASNNSDNERELQLRNEKEDVTPSLNARMTKNVQTRGHQPLRAPQREARKQPNVREQKELQFRSRSERKGTLSLADMLGAC